MRGRYRYDTGSIIDTKEHKVLTVRQAVNRLNKQDALIESKRDTIQFHVDGYNKIKQTIEEAYKTERTELGKSVLKQLAENLEIL
ncbi:MAG: fumarate hydratase [Methanobrevibacter sp.]|uniref:hypothetical protein n=1 Tax=Methanobrevibacter sp. TaxID=66852 RepID=UPI0025CF0392|nr:hypothetical protein [Methanobrevibacter sp.]MBE6508234.1 fumarate hydratase [Methanobrevibacter sp.]